MGQIDEEDLQAVSKLQWRPLESQKPRKTCYGEKEVLLETNKEPFYSKFQLWERPEDTVGSQGIFLAADKAAKWTETTMPHRS